MNNFLKPLKQHYRLSKNILLTFPNIWYTTKRYTKYHFLFYFNVSSPDKNPHIKHIV